MWRQVRCVVVGALFALLVFATSAAAEYALVLWTRVVHFDTVLAAHPSIQCDEELTNQAAALKNVGYTVYGLLQERMGSLPGSGGDRRVFLCLPDTVDQRK